MASSGGNSLAAGHISGFPIGPNDIASPIGERQPGLDESALTGAAVSLFKDQIIQIGAGIITAVHGFTFYNGPLVQTKFQKIIMNQVIPYRSILFPEPTIHAFPAVAALRSRVALTG